MWWLFWPIVIGGFCGCNRCGRRRHNRCCCDNRRRSRNNCCRNNWDDYDY